MTDDAVHFCSLRCGSEVATTEMPRISCERLFQVAGPVRAHDDNDDIEDASINWKLGG